MRLADPARRPMLALLGAALTVILLGSACAPPSLLEAHPDAVLVTRAQVARYEAVTDEAGHLRDRVAALELALGALDGRLQHTEARVGTTVVRARAVLQPFPGGSARLKLPDALRVDSAGSRGKRASLPRFLAGRRGAVLAFWATWCVPCTSPEELRQMRHLRSELHAQGAELVSMPIDGLDKVLGDRRAPTWLYPLFQRDSGHLEILPRAFVTSVGVSLPLFLVMDRSGAVTHFHNGILTPKVIQEMVTHTAFRG